MSDTANRHDVREYRPMATVTAGKARTAGAIQTFHGEYPYEAGDYIVGPDQGGEYFAMRRAGFEAMYIPVAYPGPVAAIPQEEE